MTKVDAWPPPESWTEIIVTWKSMLVPGTHRQARAILEWVEQQPGGCYHLHGWRATEGFAFRFERPADATAFALRWK
jgi:hypothetical protein